MDKQLNRDQAIELAYGLLWLAPTNRKTKCGELAYRARQALFGQLDRAGRMRGLAAAQDDLGPPTGTTPHQVHNADAGMIVSTIVRPTLESGGEFTDVLVLLESVIVGVVMMAVKLGGDEIVLDKVIEGARARLAEQRLRTLAPKGEA
jgi:hypothetical protein